MGLSITYAIYFVGFFVPKLSRDLDKMADWTESLLTTGNLKRRLQIQRSDMLGSVSEPDGCLLFLRYRRPYGAWPIRRSMSRNRRLRSKPACIVVHRSAEKQSEATSAAAATVEEVTVSIGEVAEHARSTESRAEHRRRVAQRRKRSGEACATITELAGRSRSRRKRSRRFWPAFRRDQPRRRNQKIADQTNLLASTPRSRPRVPGEQGVVCRGRRRSASSPSAPAVRRSRSAA